MTYADLQVLMAWCRCETHRRLFVHANQLGDADKPTPCMSIDGTPICIDCVESWLDENSPLVELMDAHNARVEAANAIHAAEGLIRADRDATA